MHVYCQQFHLTAFDSDFYLASSIFRLLSFFKIFIFHLFWKLTTDQHIFFFNESYNSAGLTFKDAKERYPGKQEERLQIKLLLTVFSIAVDLEIDRYFGRQLSCMFAD